MGEASDADDELMAALSALLRPSTEVPEDVVASARALFTWRTVDAELASLTFDSLLDQAPALTRASDDEPRLLAFQSGDVTIEMEVVEDSRGRHLVGQVFPVEPSRVSLRHDGGTTEGRADELGRFLLVLPPTPQRVTLTCWRADGTVIESASLLV
jgi:hypothetical protein